MIALALPIVRNPWEFYVPAAAVVGYLLYMMIRRRKGDRPGQEGREPEL